tara:strand:+ start:1103 stop:1828 length:726 start_codon:yes stop_codon:yes gene_type:complete
MIKKTIISSMQRHDIINKLNGKNNVGIELGVAEGFYSFKMMESKKFIKFYGVDSYSEFQHNDKEYNKAKNYLSVFKNYQLIREKFDNALNLFKDEYFDFVYIDGFAHTGNNGGETMFSWFKKVKIGGILSGDDYHEDWPLVVNVVNEFINQTKFELFLTGKKDQDPYSQYPSWFVIKEREIDLVLPKLFKTQGKIKHFEEIEKRHKGLIKFNFKVFLYSFLEKILPSRLFLFLKSIYKKIF